MTKQPQKNKVSNWTTWKRVLAMLVMGYYIPDDVFDKAETKRK